MHKFQQFSFKKFGYLDFQNDFEQQTSELNLENFIKIIFVKAGAKVIIDFQEYNLKSASFLFINPGQYFLINESCTGTLLYYNRDFYCVEIHDKEVACDGILFHNVYEIPLVLLNKKLLTIFSTVLCEIKSEIQISDPSAEEMIRILIKTIIIKCTRIWKFDHKVSAISINSDVEFARTFSQLVEWNYSNFHSVADYAKLIHISPKALSKRLSKFSKVPPNDIIKNRILLEAKRLLVYTELSIKEISNKLGYEDYSYFIRLFSKQTGSSPQNFRSDYININKS